jgi:ubiquinone/menaquinone biosynthesis C-methylase UbiE
VSDPEHVSTSRAVYDATADAYARAVGTELTDAIEGPIDRAFLAAFVEMSGATAAGPVADVGCGPGRVAAFLASRGLDAVGVDVSPAMVAIARTAHPRIRFEEGQLTALPFPDESLAGIVSWYSIIHTPPKHLDEVFAEMRRVLVRDGNLLVGFQAGDGERVHRADAYGSGLPLTSYRHSPASIVTRLAEAGMTVRAQATREAELDHESTQQAFLLARPTPALA